MKLGVFFGVFCAVLLHLGFLLFGGLIFHAAKKGDGTPQEVELLSEDDSAAPEKPKEAKPEETPDEERVETEEEAAPDAAEIIRNLELSPLAAAPALEEASLSAIEDALRGQAGGAGDFADVLSFASGGRIGGLGKAGVLDEKLESAFSLNEIDQRPRPIYQSMPLYPAEMRGKKVEGVVNVICIVDAAGKVTNPRIEKSSDPAFEKPALEAVKQWKFEPAVKGGQRVSCRMRIPVRF